MSRLGILIAAGALAWSGAASAQAAPPAERPLDLHTHSDPAGCGTASRGEVVVCGSRKRSPYRPDQTILDADNSKRAAANPPRVQDRSGEANLCGTVRNECGGGTIPLLEPALRVATALVDAVKGDDWREAFRNGPSDYDRYQEAKRKRARGRISLGISAGNGN